ncbi:HK97-gp10 family putative phage morphogenesis protein [Streptomyces phaeochromogenes]
MEIQGLDRLRDQLQDLAVEIRQAAFKALRESAEAVVNDTQQNVRVDSGNLKEGVAARYHNNQLRAEIGWWQNDDQYAIYHEHGTRKIPAKPALGPALEAERNKIGDRIKIEVRKVLP